jgi:hypothetical protein
MSSGPIAAYEDDPRDPQKKAIYAAQTAVANRHPEFSLESLQRLREYATQILQAENLRVPGCYRGWVYKGGRDVLVDRIGEGDLSNTDVRHPDGKIVRIIAWKDRYSHYEARRREIVVGAPPGKPLSHELLVLHEISHVRSPRGKHGPKWTGTFVRMVQQHLAEVAGELLDEFASRNVRYE